MSATDLRLPTATPTLASLEGRRTSLRVIRPEDYGYLFDLATNASNLQRWRFRGTTPSPESFASTLFDGVAVQFVIQSRAEGRPVGLVSMQSANLREGFATLGLILDASVQGAGWPFEAVFLFLEYLFANFPLRKLYFESLSFNYEAFASGVERLFEVEGLLKEHEYICGAYHDLHILSLHRRRWDEIRVRPDLASLLGVA